MESNWFVGLNSSITYEPLVVYPDAFFASEQYQADICRVEGRHKRVMLTAGGCGWECKLVTTFLVGLLTLSTP